MRLAFACPYYGPTDPSVGYAQRRLFRERINAEWVYDADYSSVGQQHREACESMARRAAEDDRIDAVLWTEHDVILPEGTVGALLDAAERYPEVDIFTGIVFRRCPPYSPMVAIREPLTHQQYEQMRTSPVPQKRERANALSYEELASIYYVAISKLDTTAEPYPVDTASMGCLLIRRSALQRVVDIPDLFAARRHVSIDNVFFSHCERAGLKLYCVPSILCGHLGDRENIGAEKWMAGVREVQRAVAEKMIEMAGSGEPALAAYARTRTRGLPMIQHAQEITAAGAWLLAHGPLRRVIEIGTHHGGTVAYWGELGAERIVAVDLPSGDFGGIGEQAADERDAQLAKLYPGYVCVRGDSHDPATVLLVEDSLHGRADLLFIDADHSYEGVRQDYFVYKHLVRPGGVILFHDIVESETHKRAGAHVYRLWQELQGEKVEFVCGADWGGLGALVVKE